MTKQWYLFNQITGYGIEAAKHLEVMKELARMMAGHIHNGENIRVDIMPDAGTIHISELPPKPFVLPE